MEDDSDALLPTGCLWAERLLAYRDYRQQPVTNGLTPTATMIAEDN